MRLSQFGRGRIEVPVEQQTGQGGRRGSDHEQKAHQNLTATDPLICRPGW